MEEKEKEILDPRISFFSRESRVERKMVSKKVFGPVRSVFVL